jgi:isoamylase
VNFITAHDGFTLNDLVSYNDKHNEANGDDNRDGHSHNRSWNCGVEGPTDAADIANLRERQKRNFLATLLLSQGTPMMLAGDERGRTQNGNNNAYCQDNAISWLKWNSDANATALTRFTQRLTYVRHEYPLLHRSRFLTGARDQSLDSKDVTWMNANGSELSAEDWRDGNMRCFGMLIDGRVGPSSLEARGPDASLLLVFNAHHDLVEFSLPSRAGVERWKRLIDTNAPEDTNTPTFDAGKTYGITGRSVVLFGRA